MIRRRQALALLGAPPALPAWAGEAATPDAALAAAQGEWRGTLSYRQHGRPEPQATLAARLRVSMPAAAELALHFEYESGGATVTVDEGLRFEFSRSSLVWTLDTGERRTWVGRIVATDGEGRVRRYVIEADHGYGLLRYTFEFGPDTLNLGQDDIDAAGWPRPRQRARFTRL